MDFTVTTETPAAIVCTISLKMPCVAGICTMIAVSWYAANITQQFFDQFYPGTK